ncbi:MAG: DUF2723 domain-containing protein [Rubrobacter sp.]|nr:DUF2723 domain-containing protein [Rubrobacter sp.]
MSALSDSPKGRSPEPLAALFVGLAAFFAYLFTLAPTVASNDAGRFQIAAPLLGTGHPTGYPTFILAGKLFTFLPFGDAAYRMNLMAAVFGGVAVALMYLVARGIGAGKAPSAGAALLFAFSATFWGEATCAEVYSMHASFLLGVMYLLLRWRERGGTFRLALAGLLFGLSLGNNAGMVLLAPAFLILLVAGRWRSLSSKMLFSSGFASLVGVSVYAYVPIRGFAGAWHNYGDPVNDWNDVWRLVSGARFQGLMGASPPELLFNAGHFLYELSSQTVSPFGYVLALAMLAGGIYGASKVFARDRVVGAALAAAFLATLAYALGYEIDDIAVYYIPVYAIIFIFLAVGTTSLSNVFRSPWVPAAPVIAAALVLGLNFSAADRSDYYDERENSEATLAALPEEAVLYGKTPIIPATYLTEVEGERGDVILRWLDGGTLGRSFESDVESGRPVFFISDERYNDEYLPFAEKYAEAEEEGGLIRLAPRSR